ncbi:TetR/AcrR family transcriptional regulator [Sphingomonas canadensis]|uniref:TetR/AcrR family transcriptional regulator n=1 Tax=Sphingomonas canadensis TaxID=1219257 RepID=A0ABW3HAS2_9SPHN|nr:TetR/AcrR family transcriptional regulator [Sphingomonas canadensis]MCW3836109.1 TetR/AcrR family transcriptional regulator [Sphingomonas canadensis]
MTGRKFILSDPARPERPENPHTRHRIEDALLALMADGEPLNHDGVAARAGVSRRTVYRYFPDREALLRALWARLSPGPPGQKMPQSLEQMLERQRELFEWFDANAPAMTVAMASAQGRAMRNAVTDQRTAAYREALAPHVAHLPEPARTQAVAAIQLLNSGFAWREMRDQWGLDGAGIAAACGWAIAALAKDLDAGGGPAPD